MSLVISSNREGSCGICLNEFTPEEERLTHMGGENHDAFHKLCLVQWLKRSDKCPWDQQQIDRTSPMLKMGWMIDRLRPAIINGAIACFSSFSGSIITTLGARTIPLITSTTENGVLVAGGLAMAAAGTGVMKQSISWTLGACLILLSQVEKWQPFSDAELIFMFSAMMVELIGMNQMLNLFDTARIARQNIGFGVFMSGLAMLPSPPDTPQAIAATALFAGVATASMGLIRRGE